MTSTCAKPGTGAGLMLEIFQLTVGSYPKVCCMKESTVASDGRLTAGTVLSADLAVLEVCAARLHASREIKIRLNKLRIVPFCVLAGWKCPFTFSNFALCRDWKTAAVAKCFGGNLNAGRRLLALILSAINHTNHPPHQFDVQSTICRNSFDGVRVLHIDFEHGVQNFIRRQRIAILLIGPQLSRGRLVQSRLRNQLPP